MQTIYKDEFVRVQIDIDSPIILSSVTHVPTSQAWLHEWINIQMELIQVLKERDRTVVYSILDASQLPVFSFDILFHQLIGAVSQMQKSGLGYMMVVKPRLANIITLLTDIIMYIDQLPIGVSESKEEATEFIDREIKRAANSIER